MKNKQLSLFKLLAIFLILCSFVNCTDESTSPVDDPNYFPLGNNLTWTYQKVSNTNINFDSLYFDAVIDTVKFTLTISDTLNNTIRYLFSRETDYDNTLFLFNGSVYSAEFDYSEPEGGPCLFWKNNFEINEKWDSWFYSNTLDNKPVLDIQVNNEIVNLDTTISLNNFSNKVCDVIEKYYLFLMSSATEQWYFSDGIGILRIDGTQNSGDDKRIYRYDLIDYNFK